MSDTCCTRLAGNAGRKKSPKIRHGHHRTICRAVSSQLRHVSIIGKNLLNSNISPTCSFNMANFGLLGAEICWRVWGTLANFNGFRVLAALLNGARQSNSGRQPNSAALNRGRHIHSALRPSHWALAHITIVLSSFFLSLWPPYVLGGIIFLSCGFFLLFFSSPISAVADWMSTILRHMVWP